MAKVREVVVSYEESRSSEFQSARIGTSVTITLEDGENAGAVFLQYLKALQGRVGPQVADRVEALVADRRERGWK